MLQVLRVKTEGFGPRPMIGYEKSFGGFWRKTWSDDFGSFSKCSCERWIRVGESGGGGVLFLILMDVRGKA